jgi:hypothetical protein
LGLQACVQSRHRAQFCTQKDVAATDSIKFIVDSERNWHAYTRLVDLLRSERALAFIGAGVSQPLGYPRWSDLIAGLGALCGEQIEPHDLPVSVQELLKERELPLVAQILKQHLKDKYFDFLSKTFRPRDGFHAPIADLVDLPFRHLLTSNYDDALERHHPPPVPKHFCLHQKDKRAEFVSTFSDGDSAKLIVHVHGRYDEPEHIVLTDDDYAVYDEPDMEQFWNWLTLQGRFVFVGFSLDDADLLQSFRRARMFFNHNKNITDDRHFAVLPLALEQEKDAKATLIENAKATLIMEKYKIVPVFYPHPDKDSYIEYDYFVSALKSHVLGGLPSQPLSSVIEAQTQMHPTKPEPQIVRPEAISPEILNEGVQNLKRITANNIARRRRTGELE